jgi:hypothetical protein
MKTKVFLAIVAAAALPLTGFAAETSDGAKNNQDGELNKLLTEMNSAPTDQKVSAIITLLNKLVERETTPEQAQQAATPMKDQGMCKCCDMMKNDQSGQQGEHSHH